MKKIVLFLGFLGICFAYSPWEIAQALKEVPKAYGVDPRVAWVIAKLESNFNPFTISFTTKTLANFSFPNAKTTISNYRNKYLVSIICSNEKSAKEIAGWLISKQFKVDLGLMQINSSNLFYPELEKIFQPNYNVKLSMHILSECSLAKANTKEIIECYNKGANYRGESFSYYNKFKEIFLASFAKNI